MFQGSRCATTDLSAGAGVLRLLKCKIFQRVVGHGGAVRFFLNFACQTLLVMQSLRTLNSVPASLLQSIIDALLF